MESLNVYFKTEDWRHVIVAKVFFRRRPEIGVLICKLTPT